MSDKKFEWFKMFKDMLRERGKYSQGRVYLLWSVFAYYITLGILTWFGIKKSGTEGTLDMENFKMIIEALEFAMTLFGGYVFGGKFLDVVKYFKSDKAPEEGGKQIL
jgi:hypothetical protein